MGSIICPMKNDRRPHKELMVNERAFLGFTIFDIVHILCAVALLIFAFVYKPVDAVKVAESCTEIVMSLLLIAFIDALAKHDEYSKGFKRIYTFAWLVLVASLLIPATFMIPEFFEGQWPEPEVARYLTLLIIRLVLILSVFVVLMLTIFDHLHKIGWLRIMHIAMVLTILYSAFSLTIAFFTIENVAEGIVEFIKETAPLVPSIIGLTLWRNRSAKRIKAPAKAEAQMDEQENKVE